MMMMMMMIHSFHYVICKIKTAWQKEQSIDSRSCSILSRIYTFHCKGTCVDPGKSTNWWAHITNLRESLDQLHSSSQNWVTHGHQSPTPSLQIQVADNPLVCIVSRFLWHGPHLAKSCSINYRPELCKPSASPYLSILSFSEAILILHVLRGGCKPNLWNNQCSQTMFGTYLYNIYIYTCICICKDEIFVQEINHHNLLQ